MPWSRLDPASVADALQVEIEPGSTDDTDAAATQVLAHLREQLQAGAYIAIQDHEGHTFIGTPAEATERMMAA